MSGETENKKKRELLYTDGSGREYRCERQSVSHTCKALRLLLALAGQIEATGGIDQAFRHYIGASLTDALCSAIVYLNDYRKFAPMRWPGDPLINETASIEPKETKREWNKNKRKN